MERIHMAIPRGYCLALREGSITQLHRTVRQEESLHSGKVETAMHEALNSPDIMLSSLSGERVVELNDEAEAMNMGLAIRETLKGNSVRYKTLIWDWEKEKLNAEIDVTNLRKEHSNFMKNVYKSSHARKLGVANDAGRRSLIDDEEKSVESSGSDLSDDDNGEDPALDRAISRVKEHCVLPTVCEIKGHMKLFETRGRFMGKERRVAYTMYDLLVIGNQRPLTCQWVVKRRFSEFRDLRKNLLKIASSAVKAGIQVTKIPRLPKRRLAGSTSNAVIRSRIGGIDTFMKSVIAMEIFKDEAILLEFVSEDPLDIRPVEE
jgi:hypothetical protein